VNCFGVVAVGDAIGEKVDPTSMSIEAEAERRRERLGWDEGEER